MKQNPYKPQGMLDPVENEIVCVPRSEDVNRVIDGLYKGEYWTILGPRHIGKTTFLNLVRNEFRNAYYIYEDIEVSPGDQHEFYQRLVNRFLAEIPCKKTDYVKTFRDNWKNIDKPSLRFYDFLLQFNPKENSKKVILLLDEVDVLPYLVDFLKLWRKVHSERKEKTRNTLYRYAIIATGSVDLIKQTIGRTSPFNIAGKLYLKDFSNKESEWLINNPLGKLGIGIAPPAREKLIDQIAGHPQLLQHACRMLVENANAPGCTVTEDDVDKAIDTLLSTNPTLDILEKDLSMNIKLKNLVQKILTGKRKKFFPYKEFSYLGAGAIVEDNSYCKIRNEIYKEFIAVTLNNNGEEEIDNPKGSPPPKKGLITVERLLAALGSFLTIITLLLSVLAKLPTVAIIVGAFALIAFAILVYLILSR